MKYIIHTLLFMFPLTSCLDSKTGEIKQATKKDTLFCDFKYNISVHRLNEDSLEMNLKGKHITFYAPNTLAISQGENGIFFSSDTSSKGVGWFIWDRNLFISLNDTFSQGILYTINLKNNSIKHISENHKTCYLISYNGRFLLDTIRNFIQIQNQNFDYSKDFTYTSYSFFDDSIRNEW